MGTEYSPDIVWKAQELYVIDRLSFAKVADRTGVTATTLKTGQKNLAGSKKEKKSPKLKRKAKWICTAPAKKQ